MPIFMLILNEVTALLVGLLLAYLPRYSQPGLALGVTVPREFLGSAPCRAILRRFTRRMLWATGLAAILIPPAILVWPSPQAVTLTTVLVPFVILGAFGVIYARARRELLPHQTAPSPQRSAPLQPVRYHPPASNGWLHALPYALLLLPMFWVWMHWDAVPAQIVRHVDLAGKNITYTRKSLANAFGVSVIMLGSIALCHSLMLIGRAVRRTPGQPRRRAVINLILLEMMVVLGTLGGYLALVPLYGAWLVASSPGVAILAVLCLASLALPVFTVLAMYRKRNVEPVEIGDRSEDRYWWFGMIYHNAADPALFVEKRLGIGYTVNLGRPAGKLLVGGVLGLVALALAAPFMLT